MKRSLLLLLIFFKVTSLSFADSWDDFANLDTLWDGQKSITNKEFDEVVEKLEEKANIQEEKKKNKKIKKLFGTGTTLHNELNPSKNISEFDVLKENNDGVLINIPVDLVINDKVLEKGYYQVFGERDKENNKIYINFYQSHFFKAKLEVVETKDDFNEKQLDFAKLLPYNDSFVKIIFGSIDFNAYAIVNYQD